MAFVSLSHTCAFAQGTTDANFDEISKAIALRQAASVADAEISIEPASRSKGANTRISPLRHAETLADPGPDPARTVFFAYGSTQVSSVSRATLQAIATMLRKDRSNAVTLVGSTDDLGSKEYCIAISSKRADVVEAELLKLGVYHSQIRKRPRGYEVASEYACGSDACRRNRRRVEIQFDD